MSQQQQKTTQEDNLLTRQQYSLGDNLRFIVPSFIGVFLFMIPIPSSDGLTIPIAILANWIQDLLADQLSAIMMIIIVITGIMSVIAKVIGREAFARTPFFQQLFYVSNFWAITRVLAAIFAVMVFFKLGPEAVYSEDTGQMLLGDLLHVLFAVFLFAGLFLPLLMNFGLLDLFGTLMTKVMRPLFRLPGRSSIDCLASWVGDGTIGVLLTSKQYEDGYYTKRESVIIGTTFSVVSITFTLVVISQVGLGHLFVPFYLTVLAAGLVASLIMPRIPPLSRVPDTYINDADGDMEEKIPDGHNSLTYGYKKAIEQARKESSPRNF